MKIKNQNWKNNRGIIIRNSKANKIIISSQL